ncbi:MAG: MFS transporter [Chloroflexota bacterium]
MTTSSSSWSVLAHREFRLMFLTQFIVQAGATIQVASVDWHIWGLTHDKLALGLVGLVRVVPIIILSLLGGVVSDAVDRRRLLLVTQSLTLIVTAILAIAVLSGHESVLLIYVITAIIAGLVAFDGPARYALLASLIPVEEVGNAARLNVVLFTVTAVLGPLVASVILIFKQSGFNYALSAIAVIPSVAVLRILVAPPVPPGEKREISLQAMKEGLQFIFRIPVLWSSMIMDFIATFFASALALLPVYATEILNKDTVGLLSFAEVRYGLLRAAPFVGAALGAVIMAQYGSRLKQQGEIMLAAVAVYGLATALFGISEIFGASLLALVVVGFSDSVSASIRNALRQVLTPSRLRGRMQSVMTIFFQGGPQLGEFEAGALAQATSTPFSVVSGGFFTVIAVGLIALTIPALRHYREMPIEADPLPTVDPVESVSNTMI